MLKFNITELENRQVLFMIETERLGNIIAALQKEADTWKKKAIEADNEMSRVLHEVNLQNKSPQNQTDSPSKRWELDRNNMDLQIQGYKVRVVELEDKMNLLHKENDNLQNVNNSRAKELDEWRLRYGQLEKGVNVAMDSLTNELKTKQVI